MPKHTKAEQEKMKKMMKKVMPERAKGKNKKKKGK